MENRLATATSGTAVESYFYDESNHRVEKKNGTNDYPYFYGPGGKLLSIRSVTAGGVTSMVADRVYFGGMLIGSAGGYGTGDKSTLTDRLGAADGVSVWDGSGAGDDQPDFATYTRENTTGFEYANQRYYSAGLGRFLSVDPYGGSARLLSPSSWNRYSYTEGDPIERTDIAGLADDCADNADGTVTCNTGDSASVDGGTPDEVSVDLAPFSWSTALTDMGQLSPQE